MTDAATQIPVLFWLTHLFSFGLGALFVYLAMRPGRDAIDRDAPRQRPSIFYGDTVSSDPDGRMAQ